MVTLLGVVPWTPYASWLWPLVLAGDWIQKSSVSVRDPETVFTATDANTYADWAFSGIQALQTWYNKTSGLWDTTGWWNSGNCLTVLGDFYALDPQAASTLHLNQVFANTFINAQQTPVQRVWKHYVPCSNGWWIVESLYIDVDNGGQPPVQKRGFPGFINDYYDDEGWWALAWIRAYDVTGTVSYLSMAESIFADMQAGINGTCGGGLWWNKDKTEINAIANELYLAVAASLANRLPSSNKYLAIAEGHWKWFSNSGMINSQNLINDGLTINANGTCTNNGGATWSYNQGVILGALVELSKATGNASLLTEASNIAEAAMTSLSVNGILHDRCEDNECGADGSQFKGIFTRNLHYLQLVVKRDDFAAFIRNNAESIWNHNRDPATNYLGLDWSGPVTAGGWPNASTQSSATDALVAAVAVT